MSLSGAEKERLLRALEEDREFRYALMGLLGFREVLERITRVEELLAGLMEQQRRLEERQEKLERRMDRLEELIARLAENQMRLEERQARLEELVARLAESQQRLEERQERLEERQARIEERMDKLEERVEELARLVSAVAHRFGVITEQAFREAMKHVIEENLGAARVEHWIHHDGEGLVYGHPATVEADVVVRDGVHILVEIKSRASKADIGELYRIGLLYEKVRGVKPRLVIVAGLIDEDAEQLAERLHIRVIRATASRR